MNATYMKTALTLKDHTIVHAKMVSIERERPAQVFNVTDHLDQWNLLDFIYLSFPLDRMEE